MIVPFIRDSEVLLVVARNSVNCNRSPSFIKFFLSEPEARRPKQLLKSNKASVFVEYCWSALQWKHVYFAVSTRSYGKVSMPAEDNIANPHLLLSTHVMSTCYPTIFASHHFLSSATLLVCKSCFNKIGCGILLQSAASMSC